MDTRLDEIHHWLKHSLNIQDYTLEPASADASFRRYFRLTTSDQSRIVMDAPPEHEDCRPFIEITQRLIKAGVNAPDIYAQDLDQGFLLIKDLGNTMYLDQLHPDTAHTLYRDAISTLISMQTKTETTDLPLYDRPLLQREMALFSDWLIGTHLNLTPPADLQDCFDFLIENALEQPQVFVHRDYHSRNLTVLTEHNPGVIDFQDAVIGPLTYDLVSLLRDCYISWPQDQVTTWVKLYSDQAEAAGLIKPSQQSEIMRWFDLMGVQRHLKASGIFARLYHRDGKDGYLNDIPRTLDYIVNVSEQYKPLKNLREFLIQEVMPRLLKG